MSVFFKDEYLVVVRNLPVVKIHLTYLPVVKIPLAQLMVQKRILTRFHYHDDLQILPHCLHRLRLVLQQVPCFRLRKHCLYRPNCTPWQLPCCLYLYILFHCQNLHIEGICSLMCPMCT